MSIQWVLLLSAFLFSVGVYGVLARRNAVLVLMSIELMLNAVNINFVAFNALLRGTEFAGQIFALFVITIAAAELGVGLAIVILIYRNRTTVSIDEVSLMKW
jgi:NADH:ubiquinone oxidoreductase subunit K